MLFGLGKSLIQAHRLKQYRVIKHSLELPILCPELKLGLSEDLVLGKTSEIGYGTAVRLDYAQFHPSVDLADFEHKRALTIHPSEGEVIGKT